jgi:hypothetical protein
VAEFEAMTFLRSTVVFVIVSVVGTGGLAQEAFKVELLKQPPPSLVAPAIRSALNGQGLRIQDGSGRTFAEIWLRKTLPASEKPTGAKGEVQFPFLADGELIGVLQFAGEGHDYRDQSITKGAYTMRYGLQPVNGDHLGVSAYRDYVLLLPAAKDKSMALPPRKQLEERSAESAGTSHPAVFLLLAAPATAAQSGPSMIHDAEKSTWSVVLPLSIQVKGQLGSMIHPVLLVVVGAAPA